MYITDFRKYHLNSLLGEFEQLFNKELNQMLEKLPTAEFLTIGRNNYPPANIYEGDSTYLFTLAVPGYSKKEIKIEIARSEKENRNILSVSADKSNSCVPETKFTAHCREVHLSRFYRSWVIPENIDADSISASMVDGILTISIAKKRMTPSKKVSIDIN